MTTTTAAKPARKAARPIAKPIRSRAELDEAQAELDALVDADPAEHTAAYDRMELLAILIAAYEEEHMPAFRHPTPQQVVQIMADQQQVSAGELAKLLGGRSRLSDFYRNRRPLSTAQIYNLRERLGIPADLLISRPARATKSSRALVHA
jgi:HTH-type transcriptional regulator/antitoxin HigA